MLPFHDLQNHARDCTLRHWWSYLTYSLLHLETGHLLLNMGLQLPVGTSLEMIHGTKRVIPLYVLGVSRSEGLNSSSNFFSRFSLALLHSSALTVGR